MPVCYNVRFGAAAVTTATVELFHWSVATTKIVEKFTNKANLN
jgi:hypothetical protein